MLACRICKVPLGAANGCAACDPVRRNLVQVGEDDDEAPSLSGVSREIVAGLRERARHVRRELELDPGDIRAERRFMLIGNTTAKVLESARKLQVDGLAAIENMAFAERAKLFIGWYHDLPPEYRAEMRARMDGLELTLSQPVRDDLGLS